MPYKETEIEPFVDQIVEKMLDALQELEEFDDATVTRLGGLANTRRFRNFELVVKALVGGEEA